MSFPATKIVKASPITSLAASLHFRRVPELQMVISKSGNYFIESKHHVNPYTDESYTQLPMELFKATDIEFQTHSDAQLENLAQKLAPHLSIKTNIIKSMSSEEIIEAAKNPANLKEDLFEFGFFHKPDMNIIRLFIEIGTDFSGVKIESCSMLTWLCSGHLEEARTFLSTYSDETINTMINTLNKSCRTAIMYAIRMGNLELVNAVFSRSSDDTINAVDTHRVTALIQTTHILAYGYCKELELWTELAHKICDRSTENTISTVTEDGSTALTLSLSWQCPDLVKKIFNKSSDKAKKYICNFRYLSLAKNLQLTEIVEFIEKNT